LLAAQAAPPPPELLEVVVVQTSGGGRRVPIQPAFGPQVHFPTGTNEVPKAGAAVWKKGKARSRVTLRVVLTHADRDELPGKVCLTPPDEDPNGAVVVNGGWTPAYAIREAEIDGPDPATHKTVYRNATAATVLVAAQASITAAAAAAAAAGGAAAMVAASAAAAAALPVLHAGVATFYAEAVAGSHEEIGLLRRTWGVWWRANGTNNWVNLGRFVLELMSTHDRPGEPWVDDWASDDRPWVEAMRLPCAWADGQTTEENISAAIFEGIRTDGGFTYNPSMISYATGSVANFATDPWTVYVDKLIGQIEGLPNSLGSDIDCSGLAAAIQTFVNIVGGGLQRFQFDDMGLAINHRLPLGSALHDDNAFAPGFHHFADTSDDPAAMLLSYDASFELDADGDPHDLPNHAQAEFVAAPNAGLPYATYRFRLLTAAAAQNNDPRGPGLLGPGPRPGGPGGPGGPGPGPNPVGLAPNVLQGVIHAVTPSLTAADILGLLPAQIDGQNVPTQSWHLVHHHLRRRPSGAESVMLILASEVGPTRERSLCHRVEIFGATPTSSTGRLFDELLEGWTARSDSPDGDPGSLGAGRRVVFGDVGSLTEVPRVGVVAEFRGGTLPAVVPRTPGD